MDNFLYILIPCLVLIKLFIIMLAICLRARLGQRRPGIILIDSQRTVVCRQTGQLVGVLENQNCDRSGLIANEVPLPEDRGQATQTPPPYDMIHKQ